MSSSLPLNKKKAAALALFTLVLAAFLFLVFGHAPADARSAAGADEATSWTCSMCPQFILPDPGKCPKCFMDLIPLEGGAQGGGRRELILSLDAVETAGIASDVAERVELSGDASAVQEDGDGEPPLSVPESAVLHNLGRTFVFVETLAEDNISYVLTEIEAGPRVGERRVVLSGLDEGEAIAASGLFRIDSAMQILGKVSLVNLPDGDLAMVDNDYVEPFQPAERSLLDLRHDSALALDEWFAAYEGVRAALAGDDFANARVSAERLKAALVEERGTLPDEFSGLYDELVGEAGTMADAEALEPLRAAFEKMSEGMTLLARRYGPPSGGLNIVFCPMAFGGRGAHWLQPGQTVDNPYHGLEMPLCGWLVENIGDEPAGEPEAN